MVLCVMCWCGVFVLCVVLRGCVDLFGVCVVVVVVVVVVGVVW